MRHLVFLFLAANCASHAADWPMWQRDAGRTASTPQTMPEHPALLWSRTLPPLRPAFREKRLQFDGGYEPVAAGGRIILASSREDCVTAYATATGHEIWRVLAGGPVRCAPVIVDGLVIFGADDGLVRCVRLEDGAPVWEKRAVPSARLIFANPDGQKRAQRVSLQGRVVSERLELPTKMQAMTRSFEAIEAPDGSITLEIEPLEGGTLLSGIVVVRTGLSLGHPPEPARVPGRF